MYSEFSNFVNSEVTKVLECFPTKRVAHRITPLIAT